MTMKDEAARRFFQALLPSRKNAGTHAHIIGASRSGKSRFIESLVQHALYQEPGFCVVDWHGTLYDGILNYLAYHETDHRPIYLLDPSSGTFITRYNPFMSETANPVGTAMGYVNALVQTWGAQDTNATPRINQIARILFVAAVATGETLPNIAHMLRDDNEGAAIRRWALSRLSDPQFAFIHADLNQLHGVSKNKWDEFVQSTLRRLGRLLADPAVFRFMAFKDGNLNLRRIMDDGGILLVNLSGRGNRLDRDSARVFATLLLADFFRAAMSRADIEAPDPFVLFLDEFQEYLTPDSQTMLDAVGKGGLHLVMAHQRMEQLDKEQASIRDSVLQNAGIKVSFRINDYDTARFMARELFIHELNDDKVKDEISRMETVDHKLETRETKTESWTTNRATSTAQAASSQLRFYDGEETPMTGEAHSDVLGMALGEGHGVAVGTAMFLRPILEKNVSSRTYYSLQEKESQIAERLMTLPPRTCFFRFENDLPLLHTVREVKHYTFPDENEEMYTQSIFRDIRAVSPEEADAELARSRAEFLKRIKDRKSDVRPNTTRPS